jgi:zinc/manganese transport system substrate-binding protein
MNLIKRSFLLVLSLPLLSGAAGAGPLKVVATTPDLASLVRSVGGDRVQVESLASPFQNPHFVDAKPSLIAKVMKADLFVQNGMELEIGWAPLLVQSSGNRKVQAGQPGHLDASQAIQPIEVPQAPDRSMGDVHPEGNPHYLADPENGKLVAALIARRLSEISPEDAKGFSENLARFQAQADEKIGRWKKRLEPFRGVPFVSYHKDAAYFAKRFGLVSAGEIEPKPGIPPTASHTAEIIRRMAAQKVRLILTEEWFERRTADSIARQTGAAVVVRATFPGTVPEAPDYLSAVDYNVSKIEAALASK